LRIYITDSNNRITMKLESLQPAKGSVKANDRVGRGHGSGGGGTAKRGHKGAKSRSGYSQKRGFEGGQMPLQRRVPKFGFKNINRIEYKAINLDTIQALFDKTGISNIDLGVLYNNGLTSKSDLVKILGRGELSAAVNLRANGFSTSAIAAIEKAGGSATVDATFNPSNSAQAVVAPVAKAKAVVAVAEEVAEAKPKKVKKVAEGDDLKLIEGIGPKIADLLINAGVITFADLAATPAEKVKEILEAAGSRYTMHDPTTWAAQAELARDGKFDELKELQDKLNGGKAE
jgi:large subunit ribosomal protein L15